MSKHLFILLSVFLLNSTYSYAQHDINECAASINENTDPRMGSEIFELRKVRALEIKGSAQENASNIRSVLWELKEFIKNSQFPAIRSAAANAASVIIASSTPASPVVLHAIVMLKNSSGPRKNVFAALSGSDLTRIFYSKKYPRWMRIEAMNRLPLDGIFYDTFYDAEEKNAAFLGAIGERIGYDSVESAMLGREAYFAASSAIQAIRTGEATNTEGLFQNLGLAKLNSARSSTLLRSLRILARSKGPEVQNAAVAAIARFAQTLDYSTGLNHAISALSYLAPTSESANNELINMAFADQLGPHEIINLIELPQNEKHRIRLFRSFLLALDRFETIVKEDHENFLIHLEQHSAKVTPLTEVWIQKQAMLQDWVKTLNHLKARAEVESNSFQIRLIGSAIAKIESMLSSLTAI